MAFEVEIKAKVEFPDEMFKLLNSECKKSGPLHKEDLYFYNPGEPEKRFRIRKEGDISTVTIKNKTIVEGGEVNKEVEFKVDSAKSFGDFAGMIGFSVDYAKIKDGYSFQKDDALVELCELKGIGWYLEVEIIVSSQDQIPSAQKRVKELLFSFGFSEKDVEPRFYSELLGEAGVI